MSLNTVRKFYEELELAQKSKDDLRVFVREAWHVIEPGSPYVHGWHIDAICEHLMAVTSGQIKDLLINVPPRHAKSSIVSVLWPVWEWIRNPPTKWLYSSYNQALSTRDSLKSRRLIQSPWFRKHYGDRFSLARDQKTKMRYDNDKQGYRIATSVDGGNTGEGGDRIVCLPYDAKIKLRYNELAIGRICEAQMFIDVWSYNKLHKRVELKPIRLHFVTDSKKLIVIKTDKNKTLEITPNHLVYTGTRSYVKAEDLNTLDLLMRHDKSHDRIVSIETKEGDFKTYNIEVQDNNNYFADGYLVHNCDDGNNATEGESKAILESTAIWWREVMSTRKNDPQRSTRVVIGQRISSLDISQVFLEMAEPVHLCLPAEYEGNKSVTVLGWSDPRTEQGELLWPQRFTRPVLEALKKELGMYGTAGQLQQRPTPRGGGIIKVQWIKKYILTRDVHSRITNKVRFIIQSWDTAFKEGEENDFSVCLTLGMLDDGFYVINRWKGKVDFPELEKTAIELANIYNPHQLLIEDKASGQSLIQSLKKRTRLPIKAVKVDRDKVSRMYAVSPIIEAGRFFVPEGEQWVDDYVPNLITFPAAVHDDDVDATTQALTELGINKTMGGNGNRVVSLIGR